MIDLSKLDRRIIYLIVLVLVSWPIATDFILPPVRMSQAEQSFELIEKLNFPQGSIAFLALDWGPSTVAENGPQSALVLEHLMRRRIPVALFSQYHLATPALESLPKDVSEKLERLYPNERWVYGVDWVNLGYRPGAGILLQSLPKSEDLAETLNQDANGTKLKELQAFRGVKTIRQIGLLAQFTGLMGTFNDYVRFFKLDDYRPVFLHGCTSITIPDAYTYLDSGQLDGLLEGNAGAAWYATLMQARYPDREKDKFLISNTALGVAHLVLIALIALGNIGMYIARYRANRSSSYA